MREPRSSRRREKAPPKPLDAVRLNDLALHYVARFATSAAKLRAYLVRKLRERGWEGETEPDLDGLVARFVERGYVDDAVYGRAKASGLMARGYGARRVDQALRAAGIDEPIRESLRPAEFEARAAIVSLAQRRRFGPFAGAREARDREAAAKLRQKQLAALMRAGHNFDAARRVLDAATIEELEEWVTQGAGES